MAERAEKVAREKRGVAGGLAALLLAVTLAGVALDRSHALTRRARPALASNRWGGPLRPAPLVSRGKPVYSQPPGAAVLVDGQYRTQAVWAGGHPTPTRPSWVAIRVGRGPSRLLLSWS